MTLTRDVRAKIEGIRHYSIHDQPYAVVYFSHNDDADTIHHAQMSLDALPGELRVGEAVLIHYVLEVVAAITRDDNPG